MKVVPNQYENYRSYLSDFIDEIKISRQNLSIRNIGKRLGWPASYMNDVIGGRKRLTLTRAVEFSFFFGLNDYETEHLAFLVMKDGRSQDVKNFASSIVKHRMEGNWFCSGSQDDWIYENIEVEAIHLLLSSEVGHKISESNLADRLHTFENLDSGRVGEIINGLHSLGVIRKNSDGTITVVHRNLHCDNVSSTPMDRDKCAAIHRLYAKNFLRYLETSDSPRFFNSGFIRVNKIEYREFIERILLLRNWMMQKSANLTKVAEPENEVMYLQYDLNLFPIVRLKKPWQWSGQKDATVKMG